MRPRSPSQTRPAGASLGSNAKSSAAPVIDPETGEVQGLKRDRTATRWERFANQSVVRKLLPDSRTAKCLRLRTKGHEIQVLGSRKHKTATYSGLQTCGSVWACPVCAAKISERRRVELLTAMKAHQALGIVDKDTGEVYAGQVLLLTLTTPHYLGDDLAAVLAGQAKALSYFNGDRASRSLFEDMKCIGTVRALEVTHGRKRQVNNGWHPHYHVLMFVRAGLDLEAMRVRLHDRWFSACARAGVKPPSLAHGVRLDDGSKAAAYASKWGLESEMTKGHTKKSLDGETPFDFLRAYLEEMDKQAGALFVEFATVFKGKRQLFWSKGLKALFGIGELSDEELAAKQDDQAVRLGTISLEQWRAVLRHEGRAVVLELAEKHGWEAAAGYLESITRREDAAAVASGPGEPEQGSKSFLGAGAGRLVRKPGLLGNPPDWLRSLVEGGFQDRASQVSDRKVEVGRHVRQLAMCFGVDFQAL